MKLFWEEIKKGARSFFQRIKGAKTFFQLKKWRFFLHIISQRFIVCAFSRHLSCTEIEITRIYETKVNPA